MISPQQPDRERHFAPGNGFHRETAHELDLLVRAALPHAGSSALDIGCGRGTYAATLARLGHDTLAVDRADSAVAATRDRHTDLVPDPRAMRLDFERAAAPRAEPGGCRAAHRRVGTRRLVRPGA
ncbi:methyltransferase domain-containing protein [Streptomyces sp. NPDC006476]|uniref:class I SAM-dependent methyltransferase n=1 Tax=Streptomyces sp. NPDC006476 TaxID=3157175 RepID=UPI0033BF8570